MEAVRFLTDIMLPAIEKTKPVLGHLDSPESRCFLLAIAGQESAWTYRVQKPVGYAHGFWQFEKRGGTIAVLTGEATSHMAIGVCQLADAVLGLDGVFDALIENDALAYGFARLNLWPDPEPIPAIGDEDGSWEYYLRVWRPGKPSSYRWSDVYPQSAALFGAGGT